MSYTSLFYWLTVADNAKAFFTAFIWIFTGIAVLSTLANLIARGGGFDDSGDDIAKIARKWIFWSYPFMMLFWALDIFTPSKKDALLIVAGGQTLNFLVSDSSARRIPSELTTFVVTELKNMATEAKVDLNIKGAKEKILDEAKNMSASELIQKMSVDSIFAKVVLNK